jgi:cellulose synthase/poly-beta-1,6-N-acetylglucosamine synthase-like glycosyltransferase
VRFIIRSWKWLAPLGVCLLLVGWVALSAANVQAITFSLLIYAFANLIVYTDATDFLIRLYIRRRNTATVMGGDDNHNLSIDLSATLPAETWRIVPVRPYAIIASIYNLEDQLDEFMAAFEPYRDKIWLISDGSTDDTVKRLRQAGWRCVDEGINRRKPAALHRLLQRLPAHIETIMVTDPDIRIRGIHDGSRVDLERVIGDFQRSGAAAMCPRIMIEPDGFLARFQAFEYALAFRVGRESLSDFSITSGVSFYRRAALAAALDEHSHSVYAEDLENAVILLSRGERIYYDGRLVVSTEGPGSVKRWFSQRVGWYHGLLKVYTERFREIWQIAKRSPFAFYHFIFYMAGLSIALHVVKMVSAALLLISFASGFDTLFSAHGFSHNALTNPAYFITAIGSYLALGAFALFVVVPRAERSYIAPIVPLYLFYAIAHIVPMSVGFANWIALKVMGRRVYRDHYEIQEARSG